MKDPNVETTTAHVNNETDISFVEYECFVLDG